MNMVRYSYGKVDYSPIYITIIVIIVILVVVAIAIFLIFKIRNERNKFVLEYGKLYPLFLDLLKKYPVKEINYVYPITHYVNSHKTLDNFNIKDLAIHHFVNNVDNVKDSYYSYIKNETYYSNLISETNKLLHNNPEYDSYQYDNELLKKYHFKSQEYYKLYEKEYISKLIPKPSSFKITVNVMYVTPRRRYVYSNYGEFTKNTISTFEKISQDRNGLYDEKEYQRSLMSDRLRYNVLRRDNFRCCICGATAKDGAKLEVDHIIPVSKGGMTVMENLQTLCKECNRGKSDKM